MLGTIMIFVAAISFFISWFVTDSSRWALWIATVLTVLVGAAGLAIEFAGAVFFGIGGFVTMFLSFFVLDGLFLWLVLGGFACCALATIEYEKPGWLSLVLALTLFVLEFYTPWHPVRAAIQHPVDAAVVIALYFAIGTAWIAGKWWFHINWIGDKFDEVKAECIEAAKKNGIDFINDAGELTERGMMQMYSLAARKIGERQLPLQVGQHKSELYMWWICWPLSLIWTFANDPVKRLWRFVYRELGTVLQSMSDRRFKI